MSVRTAPIIIVLSLAVIAQAILGFDNGNTITRLLAAQSEYEGTVKQLLAANKQWELAFLQMAAVLPECSSVEIDTTAQSVAPSHGSEQP